MSIPLRCVVETTVSSKDVEAVERFLRRFNATSADDVAVAKVLSTLVEDFHTDLDAGCKQPQP